MQVSEGMLVGVDGGRPHGVVKAVHAGTQTAEAEALVSFGAQDSRTYEEWYPMSRLTVIDSDWNPPTAEEIERRNATTPTRVIPEKKEQKVEE